MLTRKDLLDRLDVDEEDLEVWLRFGRISPAGCDESGNPFFDDDVLRIAALLKEAGTPLAAKEVIAYLGVPPRTFWGWVKTGKLRPSMRLGRKSLFRLRDVRHLKVRGGRRYSVTEAARILGLHWRTLSAWIDKGFVQASQDGFGRRYFTEAELAAVMSQVGPDLAVSSEVVAQLLGVGDRTVRRWPEAGILPARQVGRRYFFNRKEIIEIANRGIRPADTGQNNQTTD